MTVMTADSIDIARAIGQVSSAEEARRVFEETMDRETLGKIQQINTEPVLIKIANAIVMGEPDTVFINTGSSADRQWVRNHALEKGEEKPLAMKNHTVHFDLKQEQGRILDRTFYIVSEDEDISSLAQQKLRQEAFEEIHTHMTGIMRGLTLIVGFYSRGPVGAPVSNPAVEITTSAYVSHSADILFRNIFDRFDREVALRGHFFANIHSEGQNRPEDLPHARIFMDRRDRTTYSFNCTYAGNTLLLKKGNHRFAVDKAVYENRGRELAEHMFITGINGPGGRLTWCTGAAPSGCGKTATAMAGDQFVGDDLAQMWIAEDGSVRSISPECGIFGIVEDANRKDDPVLMEKLRNEGTEVIWSNVLIDDNGVPHWVGHGEAMPDHGRNFQGEWKKGMTDENGREIPPSHPNARCTIATAGLSNYSEKSEDPTGVEARVITYSGRDADTMPPVWAAETPDQGVVLGACIISAATATEVGAEGVKRAPWANAPFIPGPLGDYMNAQFEFFGSSAITEGKRPVMAGLNYFLTEATRGGKSNRLLGEKRDVKVWLGWLERLAYGEVSTISTPIGRLPRYEDLKSLFETLIDKEYPLDLYEKQFSLYTEKIIARLDMQVEAYQQEERIPEKFFDLLAEQKQGLQALQEKFGPVVRPGRLAE